MWKIQIVLSTLWKISQGPFHIVEAINVSSTKLSQLSNCDSLHCWSFGTFPPHFLNWAYIFSEDFHKSFRNLPNFFREHTRGACAIFHLCLFYSNISSYICLCGLTIKVAGQDCSVLEGWEGIPACAPPARKSWFPQVRFFIVLRSRYLTLSIILFTTIILVENFLKT